MKRTTNGFDSLPLAQFRQQTGTIISRMTNNSLFSTLQTAVADITTDNDAFTILVEKASGKDETAIINRDEARAALTVKIHQLGIGVDGVAMGNEGVLSASGFPYTQDRKTTANISKPDVPKLTAGVNNGEIVCKTYSQPGVKSFNYYLTTDAAASTGNAEVLWQIFSWNATKYTFTGLASGVRCYIKVGLVGVRGQEVMSDVVSYIPQ